MSTIDNFAIIIGAMKCGTTSLYELLCQHPQVAGCIYKEPCFSSRDENYKRGADIYQKLWNFDPSYHFVALEASTEYTKRPHFPDAAERISSFPGRFRFIYIMRNPIERIESHMTHALREDATWSRTITFDEIDTQALDISRYATQLDCYRDQFGLQDLLLLDFEMLRSDPKTLLDKVCSFLEIDSTFIFGHPRGVRNTSIGKPIRLSSSKAGLEKLVELLPFGKQKIRTFLIGKEVIRERVSLSADQKKYIISELKDELRRLNDEYAFDTSSWKMDC